MGKRNSQRKHAAMLDSDDDNSSESSSSTIRSDHTWALEPETKIVKATRLDEALDALFEKRGSTRENALAAIIEAFCANLQHQFVENKFATLLYQCLNSIKKGSAKEVALASKVIGLLALTVGCGDNAHEILEQSVTPISQALKSGSESSKVALLECLAIVTFVGGIDPAETEQSMNIIWQFVHPKLVPNVVAVKPSAAVIAAGVSSWAFLLTSLDGWKRNPKDWQESISYLSSLLDKNDRSVRMAAGESLALIFEMGSLEEFAAGANCSADSSVQEGNKGFSHVVGLRSKILNQVRNLSAEAGGKGSTKKDLNSQRNLFKDILEFLEDGYYPENSMKIGGDTLQTAKWYKLIQLNFFKHYLGGGFVKHMLGNEFLHDVLQFAPLDKKHLQGSERIMSRVEKDLTFIHLKFNGTNIRPPVIMRQKASIVKRMYYSPNSAVNKARTQFLNKQRMISEGRNEGHFAVNSEE
ncbi:hypothetical protein K2173_007876 [Erythroxylum novogranatense]|uniref:Interferon-related developmental regulator 1 n=1 Tax=Erythroxylum novogranatense TaxID=1862640 RepID=A0AAV8T6W8_9ROSI|nr:hypothetical protein K2173_007876 [Erythroxylum novogranatense]